MSSELNCCKNQQCLVQRKKQIFFTRDISKTIPCYFSRKKVEVGKTVQPNYLHLIIEKFE